MIQQAPYPPQPYNNPGLGLGAPTLVGTVDPKYGVSTLGEKGKAEWKFITLWRFQDLGIQNIVRWDKISGPFNM